MSYPQSMDIGGFVDEKLGVAPQNIADAATVNGPSIDRSGHYSCVLGILSGAATGAPSAQAHVATLEDSPDGTTGWAPYVRDGVTQKATAIADNALVEADINLDGAKKFIRASILMVFTAGTTPTNDMAANVLLGPKDQRP